MNTATAAEFVTELDQYMRARVSAIVIPTHEERRCISAILEMLRESEFHGETAELEAKPVYTWSCVRGMEQVQGAGLGAEDARNVSGLEDARAALLHIGAVTRLGEDRAVYILCDMGAHLQQHGVPNAEMVRLLKELTWQLREPAMSLLFIDANWPDIPELEHEIPVLDFPLPTEQEAATLLVDTAHVVATVHQRPVDLTGGADARITAALLGLTATEMEQHLKRAVIVQGSLTGEAVPLLLDAKKEAIRRSGSLTYSHPEPLSSIGGYAALRRLLAEAAATFSPEARAFGIEPHKGILLVGLPGCGKDLFKKVASGMLGRPLLDLDLGSVMGEGGGVLGGAERSIDRALQVATVVRGVLGISEFEKGVGGLASSGKTDGGSTARVIGKLLNWMNDQSGVFVVATANDVRQLAPEQTRQGRFGAIAFVDLPKPGDRAAILGVHLAKRGRDPLAFTLDDVVDVTDGFSGAELEAVVKAALLGAFMDGSRAVTTADLVRGARGIKPTSELRREEVDELRSWAKSHMALDADAPVAEKARALAVAGGRARGLEI